MSNIDKLKIILDKLETLRGEGDSEAFASAYKIAYSGQITEGDAANTVELLTRLAERSFEEYLVTSLPAEDFKGYAIEAAKLAEWIGALVGKRLAAA